MIKKIILISLAAGLLIFAGVFFYFRAYQNLPQFAIPLVSEIELPKTGEKVVVFAPHADDETLGAGGFMARAAQNSAEVIVVLATNGDGHRFSSMEEFQKLYPSASDYIQSGYTRQEESKKALEDLGVKDENIIFLGYPDSGLDELLNKNWQIPYQSPYTKQSSSPYNNSFEPNASYTGENLTNDMVAILKKYQPSMVLATIPQDIHPDHAALGEFTKKAVENIDGQKPQVYFYLIHFRHFPNPKGLHLNAFLTSPARLINPHYELSKLTLDSETLQKKEKAIKEYKSQLKSPLLKNLMESFLRQNELFYHWRN